MYIEIFFDEKIRSQEFHGIDTTMMSIFVHSIVKNQYLTKIKVIISFGSSIALLQVFGASK